MTGPTETSLRAELCELAASLFTRGYSVGSAGNISVRLSDGYLITPTNSCLGRLMPERLSKLDGEFRHIAGDPPSKEVFMHRAFYHARPATGAVVHLHSTHATAVACLAEPGTTAPILPLTPYFVMRIGRDLPVVPYYPPGDADMEAVLQAEAQHATAVLLANHGPVVSARTLPDAVYTAEELEEAARLHLLLHNRAPRQLTSEQIRHLIKD